RETRAPDDYELFLEYILEAPRGQRQVFENGRYKAAYKNDPTYGRFPCAEDLPLERRMPPHGSHGAHGANGGYGANCGACQPAADTPPAYPAQARRNPGMPAMPLPPGIESRRAPSNSDGSMEILQSPGTAKGYRSGPSNIGSPMIDSEPR